MERKKGLSNLNCSSPSHSSHNDFSCTPLWLQPSVIPSSFWTAINFCCLPLFFFCCPQWNLYSDVHILIFSRLVRTMDGTESHRMLLKLLLEYHSHTYKEKYCRPVVASRDDFEICRPSSKLILSGSHWFSSPVLWHILLWQIIVIFISVQFLNSGRWGRDKCHHEWSNAAEGKDLFIRRLRSPAAECWEVCVGEQQVKQNVWKDSNVVS